MENTNSNYIIQINNSLKDVLVKMTIEHRGILIVVDSENYLMGIISDGDVRRSLLLNISIDTPIEKIININPQKTKTLIEAKNLYNKHNELLIVPIVNDLGKLIGIYDGKNDFANFIEELNERPKIEKKVKNLAIIPARGGSKRIPNKNILKIGDDSLVSLAIKTAQDSSRIDEIIVSTDDEIIASEARRLGVNVPWLRPKELAEDNIKTLDVIIHAINEFYKYNNYYPELIILLEPTAPLRTKLIIEEAINKIEKQKDADSLVSINSYRHIFHPDEVLQFEDSNYIKPYNKLLNFDKRPSRLEQSHTFVQNGLVYVIKTNTIINKKSLYGDKVLGYETPENLFCDIDTNEDLILLKVKLSINNNS